MSGTGSGRLDGDATRRREQVAAIGRALWEGMPRLASCAVVREADGSRRAELAWADGVARWEPHLASDAILVGMWPHVHGRVDVPLVADARAAGAPERRVVWRSRLGVDEWSVPFVAQGPRLAVRHGRVVGETADEVVATGSLTWRASITDQGRSWRDVTSSADEVIDGWAGATRRAVARWGTVT